MAHNLEVHIYHEGDDDPKKCSALRLANEGEARLHERYDSLPRGVALDPFAERALSPADATHDALVVFDSSWDSAEDVVAPYEGERRALPFVVSANSVSYGKPFRLNTAEATVAALYILGEKEQARRIASYFSYGEAFLELNHEPLERYAECETSEEVVAVQDDYLDE
jgi:pre-rRNA-processing protein TSR3